MPHDPAVDAFMEKLVHPLKAELEMTRDIILGASPKITETIKWQCPTFIFNGNMASLAVRTKKHVQIMFHTGATIADKHGVLQGDGKEARFINLHDAADIKSRKKAIEAVVKEWVRMKSEA